jgi:hypothetical protein
MATYVFEDIKTKERIEKCFPMSRAPKYDQIITIDGRKMKRVVEDSVQVNAGFKAYVSRVPPKNTPGFKHTEKGHCIVETARQEKWYSKRSGLEWE